MAHPIMCQGFLLKVPTLFQTLRCCQVTKSLVTEKSSTLTAHYRAQPQHELSNKKATFGQMEDLGVITN